MTEEKYQLSYGCGVNSTAILALIKQGKLSYPNLRIVFADTGAEKPSTYCYLKFMQTKFNIEVVKSPLGNLYDYSEKYNMIPVRHPRWCTQKFKIAPQQKWREDNNYTDCTMILGFCYGEERRIKDQSAIYPLIELELDRESCKRIIRDVGWDVPDRSGCYICPFQRKLGWIAMQKNNPELFDKVVALEAKSKYSYDKELKLKDWLKNDMVTDRITPLDEYLGEHCLCVD